VGVLMFVRVFLLSFSVCVWLSRTELGGDYSRVYPVCMLVLVCVPSGKGEVSFLPSFFQRELYI